MRTVGEALHEGTRRLRASGSPSPRLDAELLLGHALRLDRTTIVAHPEPPLSAPQTTAYAGALERRARGEPVAYIRGFKEFHGIALAVDRRVLIPRPETELLVDLGLEHLVRRAAALPVRAPDEPVWAWDVGTGSGAIAIALAVALRRGNYAGAVRILASDVSGEALEVATENALGHGVADMVRFARADLVRRAQPDQPGQDAELWSELSPGERLPTRFDLIVANLPYIPHEIVPTLPVAASFEPGIALDGGRDGLEQVRRLLDELSEVLREGGAALLEIGHEQAPAVEEYVSRLLPSARISVYRDLAGLRRVVSIET